MDEKTKTYAENLTFSAQLKKLGDYLNQLDNPEKVQKIINLIESIPAELQQTNCFTLMHREEPTEKGKHASKKPVDLFESNKQKRLVLLSFTKHPDHLTSFVNALYALAQVEKNYPDPNNYFLGYFVQPPFLFLDVDDIGDIIKSHKNGKKDLISKLNELTDFSYCEISQSGKGLHYIMKGKKTRKTSRQANTPYEFYDNKRFVTLTGNKINVTRGVYELTTSQMKILEQFLWGDPKPEKEKFHIDDDKRGNSKSDEELLNKIRNSKNADKFNALWNRDTKSKYISKDDSYNDLQLVLLLTWWCNHDMKRVDKLFRKSALMRDKWDEQHRSDGATYGEMQLENADEQVQGGYKGLSVQDITSQKSGIFESNKACSEYLKKLRQERNESLKAQGDDQTPVKADEMVRVLKNTLILKKIYDIDSADSKRTAPLYYWDYDTHIYVSETRVLEGFILDYAAEITSSHVREDIFKTLTSSNDIETVPNFELSDPNQEFLAVENGILNLKTKELKPLTPDDAFTYKIATPYDSNATVEPTFSYTDDLTGKKTVWKFTNSIKENCVGPDQDDKFDLIMQILKSAITGYAHARKIAILCDSSGRLGSHTGKSTFEEVAQNVIGEDNTAKLQFKELADRKNLSMLLKKRFLFGDDNDVNTLIHDVGVINPLVSGDPITIKELYKEPYTTRFSGFIMQSMNGLPQFENMTYATLSRLLPVKFTAQHSEKDPANRAVKTTYIKDLGFRKWLLNYVINNVSLKYGFIEIDETKNLLQQIEAESDSITNFCENWLPQFYSAKLPMQFVYSFYVTASLNDGFKPISSRMFSRKLTENDLFQKEWTKQRMRIQLQKPILLKDKDGKDRTDDPFRFQFGFDAKDADRLAQLASATKGKTQTFFQVEHATTSYKEDDDNTRHTVTEKEHVRIQDVIDFLDNFHGVAIANKQQLELEKAQKEHDKNLPDYQV